MYANLKVELAKKPLRKHPVGGYVMVDETMFSYGVEIDEEKAIIHLDGQSGEGSYYEHVGDRIVFLDEYAVFIGADF